MINIKNKRWELLEYQDIIEWLNSDIKADGQENFFFEFKSDEVGNQSFIKEVSAFSNTYGGYIIIGVNDDRSVTGCHDWTEERIHTLIYDSITPLPIFDVKRFNKEGSNSIIVVKVESGSMPPYITNKGKIYERVSSGSIPIVDSAKLAQIYKRNEDSIIATRKMIELPDIIFTIDSGNIYGYIDLGFSIELSDRSEFRERWIKIGSSDMMEYINSSNDEFTVSKVGYSYFISVGRTEAKDNYGNIMPLDAGLNNFIEISSRGSIRSRILLYGSEGEDKVNLANTTAVNSTTAQELFIYKETRKW